MQQPHLHTKYRHRPPTIQRRLVLACWRCRGGLSSSSSAVALSLCAHHCDTTTDRAGAVSADCGRGSDKSRRVEEKSDVSRGGNNNLIGISDNNRQQRRQYHITLSYRLTTTIVSWFVGRRWKWKTSQAIRAQQQQPNNNSIPEEQWPYQLTTFFFSFDIL